MNNKRQTIWLVSMLSLMVILSAYYLFTEDVTPSQNAGGSTEQTELLDGTAKASGDQAQGVEVTEVDPETDTLTDPSAGGKSDETAPGDAVTDEKEGGKSDEAAPGDAVTDEKEGGKSDEATPGDAVTDEKEDGKTDETAGESSVSPGDEAVLKEIANLKGAQYFDELQRLELEKIHRKTEDLNIVVADTKNHTQEEASTAVEELARLEETENRMTSLEEKLLQDYDNAVVTEDEMNFRVVVQAAKLEKKQAVRIIDLAAKELNVSPDRLSVQYVP